MDPNPTNPQPGAPSAMPAGPGVTNSPKNPKQWLLWGGIALAVIIIAALAWWFYAGPGIGGRETREEIAPGQTLFTAQEGRVISGFPQDLVMEGNLQILQSYRIEYAEGNVSQPFLRYQSDWTLAENVAAFRDSLRAGAWAVSRAASAEERPATFFQAFRDNETVNIILAESDDGTVEVSIAYTRG